MLQHHKKQMVPDKNKDLKKNLLFSLPSDIQTQLFCYFLLTQCTSWDRGWSADVKSALASRYIESRVLSRGECTWHTKSVFCSHVTSASSRISRRLIYNTVCALWHTTTHTQTHLISCCCIIFACIWYMRAQLENNWHRIYKCFHSIASALSVHLRGRHYV